MRQWTTAELQIMRLYNGLGRDALAALLERTPKAVEVIASLNGISLRITDEDITVNARVLHMLERIKETPGLQVCPMCGKRFARMRTGICRCCHLDAILEAHRDALDEEIRLRRIDKARQDKSRLRICDQCRQPFFPSSTSPLCQDCR